METPIDLGGCEQVEIKSNVLGESSFPLLLQPSPEFITAEFLDLRPIAFLDSGSTEPDFLLGASSEKRLLENDLSIESLLILAALRSFILLSFWLSKIGDKASETKFDNEFRAGECVSLDPLDNPKIAEEL